MKKLMSLFTLVLLPAAGFSATDNPAVMTVAGYEVLQSEFEYFLEGNYDSSAEKPMSVMDYAKIYADYKLKVKAAVDAGIDTTESFLSEFREYRDIRAREIMIDSAFLETIARSTYDRSVEEIGPMGLIHMYELTIAPESGTEQSFSKALALADSAYAKLQKGVSFTDVVRLYSTDQYAGDFGEVGWMAIKQLPQVPGEILFSLQPHEYSKPFVFDGIPMIFYNAGHRDFGSYEENREDIYQWLDSNQDAISMAMQSKAQILADSLGWDITDADSLVMYMDEHLEQIDPVFQNVSREYHDGLLFFEISNNVIWDKAMNDEQALQQFFDDNAGKIKFDKPYFRGMVLFCIDEQVFRNLEAKLSDLPYEEWSGVIKEANVDSAKVRAIRSTAETGLFSQGQNGYVDKLVFGISDDPGPAIGFPYVGYVGNVLSGPETLDDARYLVSELYQNKLEQAWLKELHKKYKVKINKKAIKKISLN